MPAVLSKKGAQYERKTLLQMLGNSRMWCKREGEREREKGKARERETDRVCPDKHCSHETKSGAKEKSVERRARREVLL